MNVDVTKWLKQEDAEQLFMGSMPSCILVSRDVWDTFFREEDEEWNQGLLWDLLWMHIFGRSVRDGKYDISKGEYGVFLTPKGSRKEREVGMILKSADKGCGILIERMARKAESRRTPLQKGDNMNAIWEARLRNLRSSWNERMKTLKVEDKEWLTKIYDNAVSKPEILKSPKAFIDYMEDMMKMSDAELTKVAADSRAAYKAAGRS